MVVYVTGPPLPLGTNQRLRIFSPPLFDKYVIVNKIELRYLKTITSRGELTLQPLNYLMKTSMPSSKFGFMVLIRMGSDVGQHNVAMSVRFIADLHFFEVLFERLERRPLFGFVVPAHQHLLVDFVR